MLYLVKCSTDLPDADIVPWLLTSDSCEQIFAFLRIGRYLGRRTNLTVHDVIEGLRKLNRSLELDAEDEHLLDKTVAHARGRTLINHPLPATKIYKGNDTSVSQLKIAVQEGAELGSTKFANHTSGLADYLDDKNNDEEDEVDCDPELDESDEDEPREDDCLDLAHIDYSVSDDPNLIETSDGKTYNLQTAVTLFCNGGRSKMTGATRVKRFQVISPNRLNLERACDPPSGCRRISVGHSGHFVSNTDQILIRGQAMYISVPVSDYSTPDRSSISWDPVNSICVNHQRYIIWVKQSDKEKPRSLVKCSSVKFK